LFSVKKNPSNKCWEALVLLTVTVSYGLVIVFGYKVRKLVRTNLYQWGQQASRSRELSRQMNWNLTMQAVTNIFNSIILTTF
jgi:hypothetical protein